MIGRFEFVNGSDRAKKLKIAAVLPRFAVTLWILWLLLPWQGPMWAAVSVAPAGGGGLSAVTYVEPSANLSNLLINARSGQTFEFDIGTNQFAGRVPPDVPSMVQTPLKLTNLNNVTLRGSGNTVWNATNDGMLLGIQNCTNIYIEGITFRGTLTNNEYQCANMSIWGLVQVAGTNQNLKFVNCRFEEVNSFGYGGGMEDGVSYSSRTSDLLFDHCTFYKCAVTNWNGCANDPDGGAAWFSHQAIMRDCIIEKCGRGVEIFSTLEAKPQYALKDCTFRNNWALDVQIGGPGTTRARIEDCLFVRDGEHNGSANILVTSSEDAIIQGCVFSNSYAAVVNANAASFGLSRNLRLMNNTFTHVGAAVSFYRQLGGAISGNLFHFVTNGSLAFGSDGTMIENNTFYNCGLAGGAGSEPVYGSGGPGTNCVIRHNSFIRKSGGSPVAWINIGSGMKDTVILDNSFEDVSGAIPTFIDEGGLRTRFATSDGFWTNSIIAGAGSGSTNYTLFASRPTMYLGSSNISITAVMHTSQGYIRPWTAMITNLSAINWGFGVSSTTNRWHWWGNQGGGTNAPTVLSNNTALFLRGMSDGTNTFVNYEYYRPGL